MRVMGRTLSIRKSPLNETRLVSLPEFRVMLFTACREDFLQWKALEEEKTLTLYTKPKGGATKSAGRCVMTSVL